MFLDFASRAIRGWDRVAVLARSSVLRISSTRKTVFLMFHSIGGLPEAEYIVRWGVPSAPVEQFKSILGYFSRRGFRTITAGEYARRALDDAVEPRTLVLTFDDGFLDNYRLAAPILQDYGMTATFYPVVGWVGHGTPVWLHRAAYYLDRAAQDFVAVTRRLAGERWAAFFRFFRSTCNPGRDALLVFRQAMHPAEQRQVLDELARLHGGLPVNRLYMNWAELAELHRAGMEIGAHTMTHRSLWTMPLPLASREIVQSKRHIEERLGIGVTTFAYPYGHYLPEHLPILSAAGFRAAVTVRGHSNEGTTPLLELGRHGICEASTDRYALGRIVVDRATDPVVRVNRLLGRHLDQTMTDPENGLVTFTSQGIKYDPRPGVVVLSNE